MRVIILILSLTACSALPPEPFDYGNVVAAPVQCQQYQRSGGFCSLQFALDEVHARFEYQPDHVTHAELNSFAGVDVWQMLPQDGRGDCEDFALTLRWYLSQRGITGTNLLVVRTQSGLHMALELDGWIMDNTSRFLRTRSDLPDWDFIAAADESGIWRTVEGQK